MKKLLFVFLFASGFGCRPGTNSPFTPVLPISPTHPGVQSSQTTTSGTVGRYLVTTYIVGGDTLHTARNGFPIKSKLDIDNFALVITETSADHYSFTYSYYHNPTGEMPTFTKLVTGSVLNDYYYRFNATNTQPSGTVFESKLQKFTKLFYQRSVGGGINIPLKGSSAPLDQTTDKEVIIVAVPQG